MEYNATTHPPEVEICNAILHTYARKDDEAGASVFFEHMNTKMNVIHDERSFYEMIRLFASKRNAERARYYYDEMLRVLFRPPPLFLDT